jgi:hypothetical protein
MQGACGATLAASGPTDIKPDAPITPVLIEPEVAVTKRWVDAFGVTGTTTSTVQVVNRGKQLKVVMSSVHSADGAYAFLVRYHFPRIADWVDTATARDANGDLVGKTLFVAPDIGSPASPGPSPTP